MASTIYFLTPNYLRSFAYLNANIDETLYVGYIEPISKAFLRAMLGTSFWNHLLAQYNAQTLNANELVLVEMMQTSIAYRVKAELCQEASLQLTNKGLVHQVIDNGSSVSLEEIKYRYDQLLQRAIQAEQSIANYLCDNKTLFPEFTSSLNNDSSIKCSCCGPNGDGYIESSGIFLI